MNIEDLQARASKRLDAERDAKIASITTLASAAEKVAAARSALLEAERQHTTAYSKAVRLGWTDADLKDFGIDQPGKKPAGRPRTSKKTVTNAAADSNAGQQAASS